MTLRYGNPVTTLTFVESFVIKVDKEVAEEPAAFDADGNIAGVIQRINDKANFGLEYFNKNGEHFELGKNQDSGVISSAIGGNLVDMITRIENEACESWTPLAEAFYTGVSYYRQDPVKFYSQMFYSVNQNNDPFYYNDLAQFVECGNNFILIVTSGESTMDTNLPATLPGDAGPLPLDVDGDGDVTGGPLDNYASDYLDDLALWANTNDMRP